jgi:hypothetical protein
MLWQPVAPPNTVMKKTKLKIEKYAIALGLLVFGLSPLICAAAGLTPPTNPGLPGAAGATIGGTIVDIIQLILLPIVGIIAVLFIIIGGFQYITSAGNDDMAKKGKQTLTYAIIGLVIVILSYVIITVIINTLVNAN